jgi:hypothetical protein
MGDHDGLESVITIGWNTQPAIWELIGPSQISAGASATAAERPLPVPRITAPASVFTGPGEA